MRKSNIEILRIIGMFFIIFFHVAEWSCNVFYGNNRSIFINLMMWGGGIGTSLYVLISGYFMSKTDFKIRKLLLMWGTVVIYSVTIGLICFGLGKISLGILFQDFFPIYFERYWFATDYIILYLLSPFFKVLINGMSKEQHKRMCILCIMIWSFIPSILGIIVGAPSGFSENNLVWMGVLYFIGAYIGKYGCRTFESHKTSMILLTIISISWYIIWVTVCSNNVNNYFLDRIDFFGQFNGILTLIVSIELFYLWNSIKIKNLKIINMIDGTTFGIYLIHVNKDIREFLYLTIGKWINNIFNLEMYSISMMCGMVVIIFIFGMCIEFIRKYTIEKIWLIIINIVMNKLKGKLNSYV